MFSRKKKGASLRRTSGSLAPPAPPKGHGDAPPADKSGTLTVKDDRTGKEVKIPISKGGTIPCHAFIQLKMDDPADATGVRISTAGFLNVVTAKTAISFIDGDRSILRYRGYSIEALCERSSFSEVSYLLIQGNLPTPGQLHAWKSAVAANSFLHEGVLKMISGFRHDAHPMGMLISCITALGTFYPEHNPALSGASVLKDPGVRADIVTKLIGVMPTLAAAIYRHRVGRPFNVSNPNMGYTENYLSMLDRMSEPEYHPHPLLVRAMDMLMILHADHGFNCSTAAMRHVSSAGGDPYSSLAAAAAALYGPLHGGANEAVLRMLTKIGSPEKVPEFLAKVKEKKELLMGFGHRVYKSYDPRARVVRSLCHDVLKVLGHDPLVEIATALEKAALSDEYFVKRRLYPNVDFYSGLLFRAMGFPTDYFLILFALPRTVGWLAHWLESLDDSERKIARPRSDYVGPGARSWQDLDARSSSKDKDDASLEVSSRPVRYEDKRRAFTAQDE